MSEECGATLMVQQGNDIRSILHSPASDISAQVVEVNPPRAQQRTLARDYVFIEDVQPARRMVFFSEKDRPASRTAHPGALGGSRTVTGGSKNVRVAAPTPFSKARKDIWSLPS